MHTWYNIMLIVARRYIYISNVEADRDMQFGFITMLTDVSSNMARLKYLSVQCFFHCIGANLN